jgi:hypothetical protein
MAYADHAKESSVRPSKQGVRTGPDRRAHPRVDVEIPVEIDVGVYGVTTTGNTVNLSRGGVLATLGHFIEVGERCTVRFPRAGCQSDCVKSAIVVRSQNLGAVNLVALQFKEALPSMSAMR